MFEVVMGTLARDSSVNLAEEGKAIQFSAPIISPLFMINDVKATSCKIDTTVTRIVRKLSLASVVAYSAPREVDLTENPYIQHFDAKGFEILQNSDEVGVVVDLTDTVTPPRSLLHTVFFDFGRVVTTRWFKMVGLREAMDYATDVSIRIEWE
jgi:hypothetical protein